MGYGIVRHLWIGGEPGLDAATLCNWIDDALKHDYLGGIQPEHVTVSCERFRPNLVLIDLRRSSEILIAKKIAHVGEEVPLLDSLTRQAVEAGFDCTRIFACETLVEVETWGRTREGASVDCDSASGRVKRIVRTAAEPGSVRR